MHKVAFEFDATRLKAFESPGDTDYLYNDLSEVPNQLTRARTCPGRRRIGLLRRNGG